MSEILDEIVLCSFTEKSYLCVHFTEKKIWWVNKLISIVIMLSLSKFWLYGKYSAEQIIVYSPKLITFPKTASLEVLTVGR